ncbi:hypothetical protein L218DRAFT_1005922 [Marasmius fiardii PR-910]|nr:hypothetical protein L218DRAFT_1005922 [Marasmius fiardii PR-910]
MSSLPSIGKIIEQFVDPQYYGGVIAICMFGICISQTWNYICTNNDRWPLQATVAFLFLFVFGCTLLDAFVLHHYLIAEYGNLIELSRITPEVSIFALFTLIVIVTSDFCFATRVWRLRRIHWTVAAAIVSSFPAVSSYGQLRWVSQQALMAIGALIPGIILVNALLKSSLIGTLNDFHRKLEVGFVNILAAVSQCMSTFALWYSSQTHINEMPGSLIDPALNSNPKSVIQRLRHVAINRGVLLTVCQLLVAFLYFWKPERLYWSPFHQFLAPLYYITMLATLNARLPERAQPWEITPDTPTSPSTYSPSALESGTSRTGFGNEMRMRMGMAITPFQLDPHTPGSSIRGNPSIHTQFETQSGTDTPAAGTGTGNTRRSRKSFPRQAFAALTLDRYRRRFSSSSKKSKKAKSGASMDEKMPMPLQLMGSDGNGNSNISLAPLNTSHGVTEESRIEVEIPEVASSTKTAPDTLAGANSYWNFIVNDS